MRYTCTCTFTCMNNDRDIMRYTCTCTCMRYTCTCTCMNNEI